MDSTIIQDHHTAAHAGQQKQHKYSHHQPIEDLIRDKASLRAINVLCLQLRRGQLQGPEKVAEATAKTLRSIVSSAKFHSMQELIDIIKAAGRQLQNSQPQEQTVGNITRRVVHLLREEAKAAANEDQDTNLATARMGGQDPSPLSYSLADSLSHLSISQPSGPFGYTNVLPPSSLQPNSGGVASVHSSILLSHNPSSASIGPVRPALSLLRKDSVFVHGSFSISDLVAAGVMSTSSSLPTPAESSYNSTPHGPLSRSNSGFFNQQQLSTCMHGPQISVTEDPDGEARTEAQDAQTLPRPTKHCYNHDDQNDDDDANNNTEGQGSSDSDDDEEEDTDGQDTQDDDDSDDTPHRARTASKSKHRTNKPPAPSKEGGGGLGAYFLKPLLIQAIQDLIDELETVDDNIAKDSCDHIHSGEVILTLDHSKTAESFFKAAAKERKFTVIVAETAPCYTGHTLSRSLSQSGISTLLIPDSSIFAVMPRVSKVVLGAHAILANGGVLSSPGSLPTAVSARAHSTPIVVLAGVFKICPEWTSFENFSSNNQACPSQLFDLSINPNIAETVEIVNAQYDSISPDLVDVFITNVGEHPPSYVYRLVKENYDEADLVL